MRIKAQGRFVVGMVLLGISREEQTKVDKIEEIQTARKVDQLTLRIGEREIGGISFFKR
jgi:hypothetical protein